jgi:hypothetical protein
MLLNLVSWQLIEYKLDYYLVVCLKMRTIEKCEDISCFLQEIIKLEYSWEVLSTPKFLLFTPNIFLKYCNFLILGVTQIFKKLSLQILLETYFCDYFRFNYKGIIIKKMVWCEEQIFGVDSVYQYSFQL